MKKLMAFVLALALCVSLPLTVWADMDGPYFSELDAYANREGSIPFYGFGWDDETEESYLDRKGTVIPNKTPLVLSGEYEYKGKLYYWTEYNEESGYVDSGDIALNLVAVSPAEENAFQSPRHFVVIAPAGVKVYSGPNTAYDVVGTLPRGTEIAATHADNISYGSAWSYMTQNGLSGWVHTGYYDDAFDFGRSVKYREVPNAPTGKALTLYDLPLYATAEDWFKSETATPIATVPAGTELTFDTYFGNWYCAGYVTYNGKQGWVTVADDGKHTQFACKNSLMTTQEMPLYASADSTGAPQGKLAAFQLVPYDSMLCRSTEAGLSPDDERWYDVPNETWYRVTADGAQRWICYNSETNKYPLIFSNGHEIEISEEANLVLYETPETESQKVGKIEGGSRAKWLFDYYDDTLEEDWVYVTDGKQSGWAHSNYEYVEFVDGSQFYDLSSVLPQSKGTQAEIAQAESTNPQADAETAAASATRAASPAVKASPRTIIIGCVAAAALLALVAGVTVALLKKRKAGANQE